MHIHLCEMHLRQMHLHLPLDVILMDGRSAVSIRGRPTRHCLLVETDTGFGPRDCAALRARFSKLFLVG